MFGHGKKNARLQHWDGPRSGSGEMLPLPLMGRGDLRRRAALVVATAIALTAAIAGLAPVIPHREGQICPRDFRVRVAFSVANPARQESDAPPAEIHYPVGTTISRRGQALTESQLTLLRMEHSAHLKSLSPLTRLGRLAALFGIMLLHSALVGLYVARFQPALAQRWPQLAGVAVQTAITAALALLLSHSPWHAAAIPILVTAMVFAITFNPPFALMMSFGLALVVVLAQGGTIEQLVVLLTGPATASLLVHSVRTRTRLIKVSAAAGIAHAAAVLAVGLFTDQPTRWILTESGRLILWALLAGFILSGSLPLVERCYGIVTDVTLLELGDSSHPLLQELVRRAPGTYTHSLTVAALAESAAEAIGANSLLVRVGCYFHDVGKMLKPSYFVENQCGVNRHDQLEPTLSTLVILNHVKDGVALAEEYRLPEPVIDFIRQHHGTTLIEYFYREAIRLQGEEAADREFAFRYPGPKPQSREIGLAMIADAVESASRAMAGATPGALRKLIHDLLMKRLLDGQFDESGLTLTDLNRIEETLSKGVASLYHSRINYPADRTRPSAG